MEEIVNNKYTNENLNISYLEELNKHYLKREHIQNSDLNNIPLYSKYGENKYVLNDENNNEEIKDKNLFVKYKINFMSRTVISLIIFILVLCYKYYPENIKNSKVIQFINEEYNKNYGKEEILEEVEEIGKKIYSKMDKVISENMYSSFLNKYVNEIKPKILETNFNNLLKKEEITVAVFNEEDLKINDNDYTPIEEVVAVNSEVSLMAMDVEEIMSKNISIIQPVYGTKTSEYGTREEILDVVGYHTGVDIANLYNTEIKSATDGTVVKAELNNYYYGNNIEIENNNVIFKYAHMNKLLVNEGDNIKQNQVIGLMGATGQATGSHLHFEIRINGRTVDPEMLIEIK